MDIRHFQGWIIYTVILVGEKSSFETGISSTLNKGDFEIAGIFESTDSLPELNESRPDIAIISLDSPSINGWEACYYIREKLNIPVIMLGKEPGENTWARVVTAGADHYIEEPVNKTVLAARVKAILRRYPR